MLNRYLLRLNQFKTSEENQYSCVPVIAHEKLNLPPSSVLRTSARLAKTLSSEIVISPSGENKGALLPNTIVQATEMVPIQLVNDTNVPILIHVGHVLGYAMECDVLLTENSKKINTSSLEKHPSNLEKPPTSLDGLHTSLPDHLEGLFQCSKKFLNEEEAAILKSLLLKYQDIFSKGSHDIGCFKEIKHTIDTGTELPVKHPMRRTPMGFEGEEEENLKQMLEIEVISESSSDWASAPVLVRKRDGSVRYCVDCSLNAKTVKDLFPLPFISQCLDQLSVNRYFSTLDMASGYWQIEIDEKDQHKTAFITKYGLF